MKHIFILLCLALSTPSLASLSELDKKMSGKKIIVQNSYHPKPGKFDEVLALRIKASKLLKEFGFSSGIVLVGREQGPIVWHAEYESLEALNKEMNSWTPAQEKRFQKEILSKMKSLVDRFNRTSHYVVF